MFMVHLEGEISEREDWNQKYVVIVADIQSQMQFQEVYRVYKETVQALKRKEPELQPGTNH